MIPLHPVAGADPRTVRWHVPAGTLPVQGPARSLPSPVAELVAEGTVSRLVVGAGHLDVTLAEGRSWQADGPRVRTALLAGLEHPEQWHTSAAEAATGSGGGDDERLAAAARAVLAGEVGELARSHGGAIELDSVTAGVVTVRLHGACHGCPAAGMTLHALLERRLRETCPGLREIRALDGGQRRRGPAWLNLPVRRPD